MDLWLFVKALCKHCWALLSCAVFTGIGVFAAWSDKGNLWIVSASCVAAVLMLIVAAYRSWKDEHSKAEVHQAPEVMLSYMYEHGDILTEREPIRVRNTGKGTAFKIDVKVTDDSFRPFFFAIPYLAAGDVAELVQHAIVDSNNVSVGGIL